MKSSQCECFEFCGLNVMEGSNDKRCILHSEDPEKNFEAFSKELKEHRKRRGDNYSKIVFPKLASFEKEQFQAADFTDAVFLDGAFFYNCVFLDQADFTNTKFKKRAAFNRAVFEGVVHFDGATFMGYARFGATVFKDIANFGDCTFAERAAFTGAKFDSRVNYEYAKFSRPPNFDKATFSQQVDFSSVTFEEGVSFRGLTFVGDAVFSYAKFEKVSIFHGATFQSKAFFVGAEFKERVGYIKARFSREADFESADFSDIAAFMLVVFEGHVNFNSAKIHEGRFENAEFLNSSDFFNAVFAEKADFKLCKFRGNTSYILARFSDGADFTGASFRGTVTFRLSSFQGRTYFRPLGESHGDRILFSPVELDFRDVEISPLDALTFRNADFRTCLLLGTDLRKVELTGIEWPTVKGRLGLYDELTCNEACQYDSLEKLYRDLKQNCEDRRDYERAGQFHFGEKEMRRKNPNTSFVHKRLLEAYRVFSWYGEKAYPPLLWAILIWVAGTFYYLKYLPESSAVADQFESILKTSHYSLRVMLLLKPDDKDLMDLSKWIYTSQTVLGPFFFGLFALAVRQRLKR